MATIKVRAKVRRDGTLAISKRVYRELNLHAGDVLEFDADMEEREWSEADYAPLFALAGIGKGGKEDGGTKHDSYLYKNGGE